MIYFHVKYNAMIPSLKEKSGRIPAALSKNIQN